jgi:hypothetical protein
MAPMIKDRKFLTTEDAYATMLRHKTNEELHHILNDCELAVDAMPDGVNAGFYATEARLIRFEISRRSQTLIFRTDRIYNGKQEIHARPIVGNRVVFFDLSRGICGSVNAGLTQRSIMTEYDAGRYEPENSERYFPGLQWNRGW